MKWMLLFTALSVCTAAGEETKKANLAKLGDPSTREAEVARLVECDGVEKFLVRYRLHPAPQSGGAEPLTLLAADYECDFERNSASHSSGDYEIARPEELFGIARDKDADAKGGPECLLKPGSSLLIDHVLLLFDGKGNEVRPFDGRNFIEHGYLCDFNRDEILERCDSTHPSLEAAPHQEIQVFELATVEAKPRSLLRVVYNWHPNDVNDDNEWGFTCFDEEGDGFMEIAFGPKKAASDEDQRQFVFRWNKDTLSYTAGEIPEHSHIRVLKAGEDLEALAKAGGLDYALKGKLESPEEKARAPIKHPYVFKSLKGTSDSELFSFFHGKKRRDTFDPPGDTVPNLTPDGFWTMHPKQAALALAEANRTPTHRFGWKLAVDDRGGIAPPRSGWLVYDWSSSGCYSLSSHLFALRFGTDQSWLMATDYNSNGAVDRNPLADQSGYTARIIPLDSEEAMFLAETLFWLDRVRSYSPGGEEKNQGGRSSTADGFATLHLFADGSLPRELASNAVWAGEAVSGQWRAEYSPLIFINLTEHLLGKELPAHLAARWKVAPEIDRRWSGTSIKDRLKPRLNEEARILLGKNLLAAFGRHRSDPLPLPALLDLVNCSGEGGSPDLLPELLRLQATLPKPTAEDAEYETLRKRFSFDHFGNAERDEPSKHPKDYKRYEFLQEKREFEAGPVLREPLAQAIKKLRMAEDPKLLQKEVKKQGALTFWALNRLRKSFPEAWEDHLILGFRDANLEERRSIFSTLAAARPEAAKGLVELMTPVQTSELLIEVVSFELKSDPVKSRSRVPALLKIVKGRQDSYERRGSAMQLLARIELTAEQLDEFTSLLLKELKDPQCYPEYKSFNTLGYAVDALSRLPRAYLRTDAVVAMNRDGAFGFDSGLEALVRLTKDRPGGKARLTAFLDPCFRKHTGMMNDVFLAAYALDLEALAPKVADLASEGPEVEDGDGSDYAGGHFEGPLGEHYHVAREITALWLEKDNETLARMWIALVASQAYQFHPESRDQEITSILRAKASEAIAQLPADSRLRHVQTAVTAFGLDQYYSEMLYQIAALELPE